MENVIIIYDHLEYLRQFGIVCGHLVYFSYFGMFGPRKIWQPCKSVYYLYILSLASVVGPSYIEI
jgi:hypothetical protein